MSSSVHEHSCVHLICMFCVRLFSRHKHMKWLSSFHIKIVLIYLHCFQDTVQNIAHWVEGYRSITSGLVHLVSATICQQMPTNVCPRIKQIIYSYTYNPLTNTLYHFFIVSHRFAKLKGTIGVCQSVPLVFPTSSVSYACNDSFETCSVLSGWQTTDVILIS